MDGSFHAVTADLERLDGWAVQALEVVPNGATNANLNVKTVEDPLYGATLNARV